MDHKKASDALKSAKNIVDSGLSHLRSQGKPEENQAFLYELAHASSAHVIAESFLDYADNGPKESQIVEIFCADVLRSVATISFGREETWELDLSLIHI